MAKVKASLPQGTRDFSAEVVRKRNYIFNTIRGVFELYGFQPLETPAMENLETLMGKYGEEGDKLIFKILNNGNLLSDIKTEEFEKDIVESVIQYFIDGGFNSDEKIDKLTNAIKARPGVKAKVEKISEIYFKEYIRDAYLTKRALRYDLTIPFARYVAMNAGQLTLPFKRYQIQPVWRADRPQKGRYREFYQCDADVVGSNSLLNEVELVNIYAEAFKKLGIEVTIKINNRKVLAALAELCGGADKMVDITIAIDKLDKIGMDKVKTELEERGLSYEQINIIATYLAIEHETDEGKLKELESLIGHIEIGKKGVEELKYVYSFCNQHSKITNLTYDFTLARGLNYYTGTILEIKADNVQMGSIGGGGRYDDLTGLFGVPNLPGVGVSFGVDRIYDVMEELKLFPEDVQVGTQVLFFNLGEAESTAAYGLVQQLRARGIRSEIYPEQAKFDKQFKYADKKNIPYAIIIGATELQNGTCNVKDLRKGEQKTVAWGELAEFEFNA